MTSKGKAKGKVKRKDRGSILNIQLHKCHFSIQLLQAMHICLPVNLMAS